MTQREPEWTAENMNRVKGDTTLVSCGWCGFMSGGSCRHNCYLSGSCSLLKDYDNEVEWDTDCIVKKLGASDVKAIIENKRLKMRNANQSIERYHQQIASLVEHGPSIAQPVLARNRKHDHFNIGDRVCLFHELAWSVGTVVNGYRHHDGCVSYVLDAYQETKDEPRGGGFAGPWIMKQDEMEWFLDHGQATFSEWLILQDREYNGTMLPLDDYRTAFDVLVAK